LENSSQNKQLKKPQKSTQAKKLRYKITIDRNGLSERDRGIVRYALQSKSPKDAIRRSELLLQKHKDREIRIPYFAKLFLKALAISAENDLGDLDV
jgi:translation initiation factor IF-3